MNKLKISISFPPLESSKGTPLLSQNRQFQWFSDPTYIYPMIPASAATLLRSRGYEVFWDDAIAENLSYAQWLERLRKEKPDIVAIETKTPVIKRHWNIISDLKNNAKYQLPDTKYILMGDHVTALPEESLKNLKADFVLVGGDYDFLLLKLLDSLSNPANQNISRIIKDDSRHSLNDLPLIDRRLTKWDLYARKNGNFKQTPGSYVMNARDCWWGKCTFCSWTTMFPGEVCRTRSVGKALDEIGEVIKLGVKEIMEDSGTLPVGKWLEDFCHMMIERGYSKKIKIDCNMRLNAIKDAGIYKMMKRAGFRMILFGLESANQETLDRINKNLRASEIEPALKMCKSAGLEPHITVMVGYPWETKKDVEKTLSFVKNLFRKGYVDSLQATLAVPYPGTPLFKYCQENNLLLTEDYDRYDQREPVMKTELTEAEIKKMISRLYQSFMTPKFFVNKLKNIRRFNDLKFMAQAGKKVLGHLSDFS
ncbi:MAG TPA: radical SAM protein [Candidatus Bathyarchaeia archaeon]|nr:radical SAM protein [Candidatus Bathyarchaeia archaeon]